MEHNYALIIGIEQYQDAAHFASLPFAQADAEGLYRLLIDPERGGWRAENVVYLAGENATRDEIESQLRDLCLVRARMRGGKRLCKFLRSISHSGWG